MGAASLAQQGQPPYTIKFWGWVGKYEKRVDSLQGRRPSCFLEKYLFILSGLTAQANIYLEGSFKFVA